MHNGIRKILSTLLVTLGLLFAAGEARAQQDVPCTPGHRTQNIEWIVPFDCIVNGDISSDGLISIQVINGKRLEVSGNITATQHKNILLTAHGPISVGGSIIVDNSAAPSAQAGAVDIVANITASAQVFTIGQVTSNGVGGSIVTDTVNGGGNDPLFFKGGVKIRNHNGITLTQADKISVKATNSKAGVIILDALDGTVSLPTGTLSADGAPGQSAGAIILMGTEVATQSGTVISASDNGLKKLNHYVNIAASRISFQGSEGLKIHADGGGVGSTTGSFVYVLPKFSILVEDNFNPSDLVWTVSYPSGVGNQSPVHFSGSAGAPLTVTANALGALNDINTQVLMSGYPLTFDGGDVQISARGGFNNKIDLILEGQTSGSQNGLVFNANKVTLNANAKSTPGARGGNIFVSIPRVLSTSPQQVLMTADGPNGQIGNGGSILFFPKNNVTLGASAQQFHLSAEGGTTGGNGGSLTVENVDVNTIEMASSNALQASARGGNGNGGTISAKSIFMKFIGTGVRISANGEGTGHGGKISLDAPAETITVGSAAGAVRISADADPANGGDGGEITISAGGAAINAGQVSVDAGPQGSGGKLRFSTGLLELTGTISANAGPAGNGTGGEITINTSTLTLHGGASAGGQALRANGAGGGRGGIIALTVDSGDAPTIIARQQNGAVSISAEGGNSGIGGTVTLSNLYQGFNIIGGANGTAISVQGGAGQKAGDITVHAGEILAVSGQIRATGTQGGDGGKITLTANSETTPISFGLGTAILATGRNGGEIKITSNLGGKIEFLVGSNVSVSSVNQDGTGGALSLVNQDGQISILGTLSANGHGDGDAGAIDISAADVVVGNAQSQLDYIALQADGRGDFDANGSITIDAQNFSLLAGAVQARGYASKDGGNIQITADTIAVAGRINVDSESNGNSGRITITQTTVDTSKPDLSLVSAVISARGRETPNEVNIRLASTLGISINSSVLQASAQDAGPAGNIEIEYATAAPVGGRDFSLSVGSQIFSNGGATTGNAGSIKIIGNGGNAVIAGQMKADVTSSNGNAGLIEAETGIGGVYTISVSGTISATAQNQNGRGGIIRLTENVPAPSALGIFVDGSIFADAGSQGSAGSITFRNAAGSGDLRVTSPSGVISATRGTLRFVKQNRNVRVTAVQLAGDVIATGTDVSLTITGDQPPPPAAPNILSLQNISASAGNVQIEAGDVFVNVIAIGQSDARVIASGNVEIKGKGIAMGIGAAPANDFVEAGGNVNLESVGTDNSTDTIRVDSDIRSAGTIQMTSAAGYITTNATITAVQDVIIESPRKIEVAKLPAVNNVIQGRNVSVKTTGDSDSDIIIGADLVSTDKTTLLTEGLSSGDVQVNATISATGDVEVTARRIDVFLRPDVTNFVQGANITFKTEANVEGEDPVNSDINLHADLRSDGTVTLVTVGTASGNIISSGGRVRPEGDAENHLSLSAETGNIGDFDSPFLTNVASVSGIATNGFIWLDNERDQEASVTGLTLTTNMASATGIYVQTNFGMIVDSSALVTGVGDIELVAGSGTLMIQPLQLLQAPEGSIRVHTLDTSENGLVQIGNASMLIAATEDPEQLTRGNIFIYRGAGDPAENQPSTPPAGVVVTKLHNGEVYFGSKSITVNGLSSACVDAAKIVFQANDDRENVTVSDRIVIDTNIFRAERGEQGCPR